jgi:Leucine Rich Repeat (LRR) protein
MAKDQEPAEQTGPPPDPLAAAMQRIKQDPTYLRLDYLDLSAAGETWAGWRAIGELQRLTHLDLIGNRISNFPAEAWRALGRDSRLFGLSISNNLFTEISAEGWKVISEQLRLEQLYLWGNQISKIPSEGWRTLSRLPELHRLKLSGNQISEIPLDGWDVEGAFPKRIPERLRHLSISVKSRPLTPAAKDTSKWS